jgi:hypothetical protein
MKTNPIRVKRLVVIIVIGLAILLAIEMQKFQSPTAVRLITPPDTSEPTPGKTLIEIPNPICARASMVDDNGWYIFVDDQAGFSFSYPPDKVACITAGSKSVNIAYHHVGIGGHEGMSIQIFPNPDGKTVDEIGRIIYEETSQRVAPANFASISKPESIKIAGHPATKMVISSVVSEFLIFIDNGKYMLIIGPEHDAVVRNAAPDALDLFYEILSTLKLSPAR